MFALPFLVVGTVLFIAALARDFKDPRRTKSPVAMFFSAQTFNRGLAMAAMLCFLAGYWLLRLAQ